MGLEGVRPAAPEIEENFLAKLQKVLQIPQERRTPEGTWLQVVQCCLCLELLRQIPSPPARVSVPPEPLMETLRLDHQYLEQRVEELVAQLNRVSGASTAMAAK